MVVKRGGSVSIIIKALLVNTSHLGFSPWLCTRNYELGLISVAWFGWIGILEVCRVGSEVWREEEEVDAHNAQAWELIVLCRTLRCVWDCALPQTRCLLRSEIWGMRSVFSLLPPSPEWPFGNLAKKPQSEIVNEKLKGAKTLCMFFLLPSQCWLCCFLCLWVDV